MQLYTFLTEPPQKSQISGHQKYQVHWSLFLLLPPCPLLLLFGRCHLLDDRVWTTGTQYKGCPKQGLMHRFEPSLALSIPWKEIMLMCVYACVHILVCAYLCMGTCLHMCAHAWGSQRMLDVSLNSSLSYFFETGSLHGLGAQWFNKTVWPSSPRDTLTQPSQL